MKSVSLGNDEGIISYVSKNKLDPVDYLIEKVHDNYIVILGKKHHQTHQLEVVISFIKRQHKDIS